MREGFPEEVKVNLGLEGWTGEQGRQRSERIPGKEFSKREEARITPRFLV